MHTCLSQKHGTPELLEGGEFIELSNFYLLGGFPFFLPGPPRSVRDSILESVQ